MNTNTSVEDDKRICQQCNGDGWYADRDPKNPYGEPVQVQCEACYGEGKV